MLDGDVILPADGPTVNERRRIGYSGLITVAVPVGSNGKLAGKPLIRPFGVPVEEDRDDFIADATDAATKAYQPGVDEEKVREAVRLAVRRCATLWTGKKPLVEVMLLEVARCRMQLASIIAIYFLFFAASAFFLLPFGVRTDEEAGTPKVPRPGRQRAAPLRSQAPSAEGGDRRRVLFALY